jgi:hypothetical protein
VSSFAAAQHVDDLPEPVDRPGGLGGQRREPLHLTENGDVIDLDPPLASSSSTFRQERP